MCEVSAGWIGLGALLGLVTVALIVWALRLVEDKREARIKFEDLRDEMGPRLGLGRRKDTDG